MNDCRLYASLVWEVETTSIQSYTSCVYRVLYTVYGRSSDIVLSILPLNASNQRRCEIMSQCLANDWMGFGKTRLILFFFWKHADLLLWSDYSFTYLNYLIIRSLVDTVRGGIQCMCKITDAWPCHRNIYPKYSRLSSLIRIFAMIIMHSFTELTRPDSCISLLEWSHFNGDSTQCINVDATLHNVTSRQKHLYILMIA